MRIGLIQPAGIGDIVIALPIAQDFVERGHEVYWPIDRAWVPSFSVAAPEVHFIPIDRDANFAYVTPHRILTELACDRIFPLMSHLGGSELPFPALARSLKFDEYKYAVAGVSFSRKWRLRIHRDRDREHDLSKRLELKPPYICTHLQCSHFTFQGALPSNWIGQRQVVHIEALTDNPFDWMSTLEGASELLLIDSCFANLVEQLNLPNPKIFICRSTVEFTPVMKNGWRFANTE